jgi:hypothetical protein
MTYLKEPKMNNKKNKIIFCEKPSQLKHVMKELGEDGDIGIICPAIAAFKFSYPEKINYQDIPSMNSDPIYLNNCCKYGNYGYVCKNGEMVKSEILFDFFQSSNHEKKSINDCDRSWSQYRDEVHLKTKDYIESFGEIICATDNDKTGVRGFEFYMEKYLGFYNYKYQLKSKDVRISHLMYASMDRKGLLRAYDDRKLILESPYFDLLCESYKKKDYFEYNFNINSLILFGDILRNIGIYGSFIINKNMLLTMMIVESFNKISEHILIKEMEKNGIGQACSRSEIIERIYNQGLFYYTESKKNGKKIRKLLLSEDGEEFLLNVHPKVKDPKMALHVEKDINSDMSISKFKEKYREKFEIMFSKQKRFLRVKKEVD